MIMFSRFRSFLLLSLVFLLNVNVVQGHVAGEGEGAPAVDTDGAIESTVNSEVDDSKFLTSSETAQTETTEEEKEPKQHDDDEEEIATWKIVWDCALIGVILTGFCWKMNR